MTDPRLSQGPPVVPVMRSNAQRLALGRQTFSDKVMQRVKTEPRPTPARAFVRSLLAFAPRDAAAALATAGRLGFGRTHSASPLLGLQSLTVIVVVLAIVGIGGPLAASGTLNALGLGQGPRQPLPGGTSPAFVEIAAEASPEIDVTEASARRSTKPAVKRQQADTKQRATSKPQASVKQQAGASKQRAGSGQRKTGAKKRQTTKKRQRTHATPTPRPRETPEPGDDDQEDGDDSSHGSDPDETDEPDHD